MAATVSSPKSVALEIESPKSPAPTRKCCSCKCSWDTVSKIFLGLSFLSMIPGFVGGGILLANGTSQWIGGLPMAGSLIFVAIMVCIRAKYFPPAHRVAPANNYRS